MYHARPCYLALGKLHATFKLSYLECGPIDQSCANTLFSNVSHEVETLAWSHKSATLTLLRGGHYRLLHAVTTCTNCRAEQLPFNRVAS